MRRGKVRKPGRNKSKASSQTQHAKNRAFARYGIKVTDNQLKEIAGLIRNRNGANLIIKQSHRRSIWSVVWNSRTFVVAYDKQRKTIMSFLPLEAMDKDKNGNEYKTLEEGGEPEVEK